MRVIGLFVLAGLFEIGGGTSCGSGSVEQRSWLVGLCGMVILALYGIVPTFQPAEHPFGRVYAAYGVVFIALSALWGWWVDGQRPDLRDAIGTAVCVAGAAI